MRFLGCSIRELHIENSTIALKPEMKKQISMDVAASEMIRHNNELHAKLLLTICMKLAKEEDEAGEIDISLEGAFAVPESTGEDEFMKLILLNGATTLYSIARGKVEAITALTFTEGKITLPLINMVQYYEEKAQAVQNANKAGEER